MKKMIALATLGIVMMGSAYGYTDETIAALCPTTAEVSKAIEAHHANITRDTFLTIKGHKWKSGAEIPHAKAKQMKVRFLELNLASNGPLCGYEIQTAVNKRAEPELTQTNVKFMRSWDKDEKPSDYQ